MLCYTDEICLAIKLTSANYIATPMQGGDQKE